jgi:antitoxin (DNA-binding transcriptional repressor) of toxin-antitoxin stability system
VAFLLECRLCHAHPFLPDQDKALKDGCLYPVQQVWETPLLAIQGLVRYCNDMSTATIQQIGQNLRAWLAAVQRGETIAIVDNGREIARLTPPRKTMMGSSVATQPSFDEAEWARQRMADLEATFPQPVEGASAVLEDIRTDRI